MVFSDAARLKLSDKLVAAEIAEVAIMFNQQMTNCAALCLKNKLAKCGIRTNNLSSTTI